MKMEPRDVMGALYSAGGLRFGGFGTDKFFFETASLEERKPGVREEIVAEAHYLVFWLHRFPEVAFFLGIAISQSLLAALLLFVAAYILEITRFYLLGASPIISHACRVWNWIKIPLFVIAAIGFWQENSLLSITLIVFLVVQGWFDLVASVAMLPIRLIVGRLVYKMYGGHWHNMEGVAMGFVINRQKLKLFQTTRLHTGD